MLRRLFNRIFGVTSAHPLVSPMDFSNCARKILSIAAQVVMERQQTLVQPEYLLLAIMKEERCTAFLILRELGMDAAIIDGKIFAGPSESFTPKSVTLSPDSKDVLEIAVDEARRLN